MKADPKVESTPSVALRATLRSQRAAQPQNQWSSSSTVSLDLSALDFPHLLNRSLSTVIHSLRLGVQERPPPRGQLCRSRISLLYSRCAPRRLAPALLPPERRTPPLKGREQAGLVDKAKNNEIMAATLPPWLMKHREAISEPLISGFINTVRQIPGTNKVGAIGLCWGGRYAVLQARGENEGSIVSVNAAYACHPSLVAIPGDFGPVTKPLSLALGDKDSLLDEKIVGQIQDVLAKKTNHTKLGYEVGSSACFAAC